MGAVGSFAKQVQDQGGKTSRGEPDRLAALTRLRALLIGWVVLYHLELNLGALRGVPVAEQVALKGYLGVDGFFVLSGFALFLGYRHRPPLGAAGWAAFVRRRAIRIFPLHLVALSALVLLVAGAAVVGLRINDPQRFGGFELAMQALLLHAWETTRVHAWNYPSWALSAIWAGYLLFPLLLAMMLDRGRAACWVIAAACLAGLGWLAVDPAQLNRTLHLGLVRFGLEFVLGMSIARLVTLRAVGRGIAAVAVLLPIGVALSSDVAAVAGLAAVIAWLAMRAPAEGTPRDLASRLGEASFGVYLSWVFVEASLVVALRVMEAGPGLRLAMMGAGLVATFALGWLAWRFVEVPTARRLTASSRGPGGA
jgi:peptidoglycan/LPS O-acetylase OafA/YrhL